MIKSMYFIILYFVHLAYIIPDISEFHKQPANNKIVAFGNGTFRGAGFLVILSYRPYG